MSGGLRLHRTGGMGSSRDPRGSAVGSCSSRPRKRRSSSERSVALVGYGRDGHALVQPRPGPRQGHMDPDLGCAWSSRARDQMLRPSVLLRPQAPGTRGRVGAHGLGPGTSRAAGCEGRTARRESRSAGCQGRATGCKGRPPGGEVRSPDREGRAAGCEGGAPGRERGAAGCDRGAAARGKGAASPKIAPGRARQLDPDHVADGLVDRVRASPSSPASTNDWKVPRGTLLPPPAGRLHGHALGRLGRPEGAATGARRSSSGTHPP